MKKNDTRFTIDYFLLIYNSHTVRAIAEKGATVEKRVNYKHIK